MNRDAHEQNRLGWNAATAAHQTHIPNLAAFLREGGTTLFPEDLALLGFLRGKSLVHLQCNAGADTVSIARAGARVMGVDISEVAIEAARALAAEVGVPAGFVCSDVYDFLETAEERFDVAYASYGAIPWLSDVALWARGVRRVLRPGGRLVVVEFHPLPWIFDDELRWVWPYSTHGRPLVEPGVGDYVAASEGALSWGGHAEGVADFVNPHQAHSFPWGLGEVLGAVIAAGLRLDHVQEYEHCNGCRVLPGMVRAEGRRWVMPPDRPAIPLMYSFVATRSD